MNPYGGYTPAEAIRDVGTSLSDIVKSFANVQLLKAKAGLDMKQLELEKVKTTSGLKKDLALAEVAKQKELGQIRKGESELALEQDRNIEAGRHNVESERMQGTRDQAAASYQDKMAAATQQRAATDEQRMKLLKDEKARLDKADTWGNLVEGSGMPPSWKKVLRGNTDKEDWDKKITTRQFEGTLKELMSNPKVLFSGTLSKIEQNIVEARDQIRNAKSEEEAVQVMEQKLLPQMSAVATIKAIVGTSDKITAGEMKGLQTIAQKNYEARIENGEKVTYEKVLQEAVDGAKKVRGMVYGAKPPTEKEFRALIKKQFPEQAPPPSKKVKAQIATKWNEAKKLYPTTGNEPNEKRMQAVNAAIRAHLNKGGPEEEARVIEILDELIEAKGGGKGEQADEGGKKAADLTINLGDNIAERIKGKKERKAEISYEGRTFVEVPGGYKVRENGKLRDLTKEENKIILKFIREEQEKEYKKHPPAKIEITDKEKTPFDVNALIRGRR